MSVAVFVGPSLRQEEVRAALPEASILPPIQYGDAARLCLDVEQAPTCVAVIDGYFSHVPAVWHKELLFLLHSGIAVLGAASMGALRAVELEAFGMVGVGRVFESYREQRFGFFDDPFDGDDEVAVIHGPSELGFVGTLALVDIRWRLERAVEAGVVAKAKAKEIAAAAKTLPYPERTEESFLETAAKLMTDDRDNNCAALTWLESDRMSLKREDTRGLIRRLAAGAPEPTEVTFHFEYTENWQRLLDAVSDDARLN